jgi:hypothetical protein
MTWETMLVMCAEVAYLHAGGTWLAAFWQGLP